MILQVKVGCNISLPAATFLTSKPTPSSLEDDEEDYNEGNQEHDKDVVGEDGLGFVWTPPVPEEEDDQDLCQQLLGMLVVHNWRVMIVGIFECKREHYRLDCPDNRYVVVNKALCLAERRQVIGKYAHIFVFVHLSLNLIVLCTIFTKATICEGGAIL